MSRPTLEPVPRATWRIAGAYTALIAAAETTTLINPTAGMIFHLGIFVLLASHAAYLATNWPAASRMLYAFTLAPLIRIVSLSAPLSSFAFVQWFGILAAVMYVALFVAIRTTGTKLCDIGFVLPARAALPWELGVVGLGFGFGLLEYQILRPFPLLRSLTPAHLLPLAFNIFLATGLLEEVIFRGFLLRHSMALMGTVRGALFGAGVFAALHIGFHSVLDLVFVGGVALTYSAVRLKTRSIIGVSISHAINNILLFLVLPLWT